MLNLFALGLGLTLAVELPVALLWGLPRRDLALCALVNLLTNPAVVLLHQYFPGPAATLALELAAVLAEGWYYRRYGRRVWHPWLLSLSANALSFGLGLILF